MGKVAFIAANGKYFYLLVIDNFNQYWFGLGGIIQNQA